MKEKKLKPSQEVIYHDGDTLMEITTVVDLNKSAKTAKLANKVIVSRVSKEGRFDRIDGKPGYALEINEKNQLLFDQYQAYFWVKRKLEALNRDLTKENALKIKKAILKIKEGE